MNSLPIRANFTSYLAEAAPATGDIGSIEKWPLEFGGEAAPQTSGVVDAVTNGTGTIEYADASRADNLETVAVKVGDEYVSCSPEGQQAAAAGAGSAPISQRLFDKASAAVAAIK